MIKPDALWNFFLSAPDLETIGRVCMALSGRRDELREPLNKFEESYVREIVQSAEWYDEATEHIAKRKRKNYLLEKKSSKGITEEEQVELDAIIEALNYKPSLAKKARVVRNLPTRLANPTLVGEVGESGESGKTDFCRAPSVRPSVRPSIRPSVHPSIDNKEGVVIKGGAGGTHQPVETTPSSDSSNDGLKFSAERLRKIVTPFRMGDVLHQDEIEPFIQYVIDKGFCEKEANQTVTPSYIKSIARTWKSEGWCDKDRHRITRKELADIVQGMNQDRDEKITSEYESRFWDFLVSKTGPFTHKNGDMVTKYTVGKMLVAWLNSELEPERRRRREEEQKKAEAEAKKREDEEREWRIQQRLLQEEGWNDD